jgi:hypothetical protein
MIISHIKKLYLIKTRTSLSLFVLAVGIFVSIHIYERRLQNNINVLHQQLAYFRQNAARSLEIRSLIKSHEKEFENFENCKFDSCFTEETLTKHQPYRIEFGPQTQLSGQLKNSGIISQEIIISLPCLMDKDVFNLINQLLEQGPGIFQIQEIEIKRLGALSEDMLEKIASGKPQILFDGRIKASWTHR